METDFSNLFLAADNHNIGNVQLSWLDPDSWGLKLGNAGKMAAVSILSGADSFYNTGVSVANWFGAGITERTTEDWIISLDSNLGGYYSENKEFADIAGFVLGSLIPGLGGIKAFNAGQRALKLASDKGNLGSNISKATGLLIPKTEQYIKASEDAIKGSITTYKLINADTLKALGAGVHQNVLEGVAFEIAVQATMFKSPVLEPQDAFDIAKNLAIGGIFSGVVGGTFSGVKTFYGLRKVRDIEEEARFPFISRPGFAAQTTPSERIVLLAEDSDATAIPLSITKSDGIVIENNYAINTKLREAKIQRNNNDTRSSIQQLSDGDTTLANVVANSSQGLSHEQMFANFHGVSEIGRINELSKAERAFALGQKSGPVIPTFANRFVKLIGEDAGKVSTTAPEFFSLGDLHVGREAILSAVKKYGFSTNKEWDPLIELGKGKTSYLQGEARFIWAQDVLRELRPGTIIHELDIPLLQRAYTDKFLDIKISAAGGLEHRAVASLDELYGIIKESQQQLATILMRDKKVYKVNTDAISSVTNMRRSYIEGTTSASEFDDVFTMQAEARKYLEDLQAKKLPTTKAEEAIDPKYLPKYGKFTYALGTGGAADGMLVDAITLLRSRQKLYEQEGRMVATKILGEETAELFPTISNRALQSAAKSGSGPGLISGENSNYGTIGSHMAFIGSRTKDTIAKFIKVTQDRLDGSLSRMGANTEAAIEFEAANQRITRSGQSWIYDKSLGALITKKAVRDFSDGGKNFDESQVFNNYKIINPQDIPEDQIIKIFNQETKNFIVDHIERSGERTNGFREIRATQGHTDFKDPNTFRPIRPNLRDFNHFAFVVDDKVTGSGHQTMLHAATEKALGELIDKVPKHRYRVITKADSEDFFKARGEYEYGRSLHENYLDTSLKNEGVFSNFFPKSDPQRIVNDILQQHMREDETLVREAVRLMYEPKFNVLEDLGRSYSKIASSKFGQSVESLEKVTDNPYFNLIKTALDISKAPEYGLLHSFNKNLDSAFSRAYVAIKEIWDGTTSPAKLEAVNLALDKYGMKPALLGAYDAGMYSLLNHTAPRGELTKFVRAANAILSTFVLGLDPLNALNNAIGSNILRTTELRNLVRAINEGNAGVAGELSRLAKVTVPGTSDEILSSSKLITKAIENFFGPNKFLYIAKYKEAGFIRDLTEQFHLMVDDFTLQGTETVAALSRRTNSAFNRAKELARAGEKFTGNTFAEEFNRFISANVMDQITSIAVRNGIMSPRESLSYINTFVNRVEGNIIATQRPLIFQGPIGQAIGLFQSYQFNLIQQVFRYVGEGSKKDVAMLFGLQSTLYGMQSLPAFQFINTHIIGTLGGNKEHKDIYDATYGVAGKQAGDFLLYGLPSNLLQANIYSRGDINPRQVTVIPTNVADIPIVAGWSRFFGSMSETVKKISGGGAFWESFLQGLEHNGISRPLAGLSQVFQAAGPEGKVFSTSSKGSILGSNDLFHWSSMVRLAGGRPLDEAITNDALFRVNSYEATRRAKLNLLAETVKTSLIGGRDADPEAVNNFAEQYVNLGGKQAQFNTWMMQMYKNANVPQAEQLNSKLTHPFAYKMQLLMGGEE